MIVTAAASGAGAYAIVRIELDPLVPESGTMTVTRRVAGQPDSLVRGFVSVPVAGTVITDHEVPLNRAVSWVVSWDDGQVVSSPVTVAAALCMLTDPISGDSVPVWIQDWPDRAIASQTVEVEIPGREDVIIVAGVETLPTSAPVLMTRTAADEAALGRLCAPGRVLQLRAMDPAVEDAYLSVRSRSVARLSKSATSTVRLHPMAVRHAAAPDMDQRGAGDTLGDLAAAVPTTLGDIAAAWSTLGDIAAADLRGSA